jgi:hypothetical protein
MLSRIFIFKSKLGFNKRLGLKQPQRQRLIDWKRCANAKP